MRDMKNVEIWSTPGEKTGSIQPEEIIVRTRNRKKDPNKKKTAEVKTADILIYLILVKKR